LRLKENPNDRGIHRLEQKDPHSTFESAGMIPHRSRSKCFYEVLHFRVVPCDWKIIYSKLILPTAGSLILSQRHVRVSKKFLSKDIAINEVENKTVCSSLDHGRLV